MSRARGSEAAITGVLRIVPVDGRPADHLNRGDVAVCADLHFDAGAARALIDRAPAAVLSTTTVVDDPDLGVAARMLVQAGIPVLDASGADLPADAAGKRVEVYDDRVVVNGVEVVVRTVTGDDIRRNLAESRAEMLRVIDAFTHGAGERLKAEADTVFHGMNIPALTLPIGGRPVVVAGPGSTTDLRALRRFIAEQRPFLLGADSGADALLGLGMQPDIVIADDRALLGEDGYARVSERVLKHARVVVHREAGSREAAAHRLSELRVRQASFPTTLSSMDAGLLLAHAHAASAVIVAGSRSRTGQGLVDDYLTGIRLGDSLTSARVVSQIYAGRVRAWQLVLVAVAALLALLLAVGTTPIGNDVIKDLFS